jgi:undecaprenyl diphosphate synthase
MASQNPSTEMEVARLGEKSIPVHVAIIMDGNGRWAKDRGFGRTRGHREGAKRVDEIVTECVQLGVKYLTLYAFSTENWDRPNYEVNMLMRLLVQHLRVMDKKLLKNNVALVAQGTLGRLPKFVQAELKRVTRLTDSEKPSMHLNLCLSYGGRQEIVDCVKKLAQDVMDGKCSIENINEKSIQSRLYHPEIPDPDLLIRTGGEYRVSNFLLWEIAYSEFYVANSLWPDFGKTELREAFAVFGKRQRRFGKTSEQMMAKAQMAQSII